MPSAAVYTGPPTSVRLHERINRYLAIVQPLTGGPSFEAHVPNPGRMEELLVPGETVGFVVAAPGPTRRTRHDLIAVEHGATLVSIDARVANRLSRRTLSDGAFGELRSGDWVPEVTVGHHRFDFGVRGTKPGSFVRLLEVKSSNLRVGDAALFPDAPTERGRRHLDALSRWARSGVRCTVLFAVQRPDVREFRPNAVLDPLFAQALSRAQRSGVEVRARTMRIEPTRVRWGRWIPVAGTRLPEQSI